MTLEEQKLAVCEKLPELIKIRHHVIGKPPEVVSHTFYWKEEKLENIINWPTQGLQVCHEAEELCDEWDKYDSWLCEICHRDYGDACHHVHFKCATYEQRLEALCRVWWPERFV
ncbi:MAG: hypothetical protein KGL39_22845 [Patescibacteria group bacterium]|nr:hypothetical protein [Patescibacteria group bacterium]